MIKNRLFWKILIIFWITFILTSNILWVISSWYSETYRNSPETQGPIHAHISVLKLMLENIEHDKFTDVISDWPQQFRQHFSIKAIPEDEALTRIFPPHDLKSRIGENNVISFPVATADGRNYIIYYSLKKAGYRTPPLFFRIPNPLLILGVVGGLILGIVLAASFSHPMNQLKFAFSKVSEGDLKVRLFPKMRNRHDEFRELSKDFDAMVGHLELLVKGREELLHDVSHELRTPLARLQLAIGLAQQSPKNVESALERIALESQRLDKMIGEVLVFSRLGEEPKQNDDYFDVLLLVEMVIEDANYEIQQSNISVRLDVEMSDDNATIVNGDAESIRRALENIVRNAVRFSSSDQVVTVSVRSRVESLEIEICDQGPGVEEDKLSSIFEPFVRLQSPLSGKGYGLGLAIARKAILEHQGKISARNAENGGLSITILLPYWHFNGD